MPQSNLGSNWWVELEMPRPMWGPGVREGGTSEGMPSNGRKNMIMGKCASL